MTALADLLQAIDPEFGIIRRVSEHRRLPGDLPIHIFSAELSDTSVYSPAKAGPQCGGAGLTKASAVGSAVGEALERYCLGWNQHQHWFVGSPKAMSDWACDLLALPVKLGDDSVNNSDVLDWVLGWSHKREKPILIPANLINVPYVPLSGRYIAKPISSGAALAARPEEAIARGLLEVVERDAFMRWWLTRGSATPVSDEDIETSGTGHVVRWARAQGLRCYVLALQSSCGAPVVCAVCRSPSVSQGPSLSIGAAARFDLPSAIAKAVIEMAHTRAWQLGMMRARDWDTSFGPGDIREIADHPRLWTHYKVNEELWFEEPRRVERPIATSASFEKICGQLHGAGFEVLSSDITTSDVRSLGVVAARTIVPGLHPLEVGRHPHLSRRLMEDVGFGSSLSELVERLNPDPHPFP